MSYRLGTPTLWPSEEHSSELEFGSFLYYPTRPNTPGEHNAKAFMLAIKKNAIHPDRKVPLVDLAISKMTEQLPRLALRQLFDPKPAVVPVPGSGLPLKNSVWPARVISEALVRVGLASEVLDLVHRQKEIRKSAFCKPADRPTVKEHVATLGLGGSLPFGLGAILLVDDILTRGATMMAVALRLRGAYDGVQVRGFALARSGSEPMEQWAQPTVGRIHYETWSDRISRRP